MNPQPETLAPDLNVVRVQHRTTGCNVGPDLNVVRVQRLTRFLDVTREPERSEGSASVHPITRMNVGEFHLMRHLQFPSRKGGIFRPGAYSLAPRHSGLPSAAPKGAGNRWVARSRTYVPPRGASRYCVSATAAGSGDPGWRSHRPQGGEGPFPDGNYGSKQKIPMMFPGCFHGKEKD